MHYHSNDLDIKTFLFNQIQGFKEYSTCDIEDDIYLFFGNLGGYIQYCIDNEFDAIVDQIYDFINSLIENADSVEFENMISVQIFEMQCDNLSYYDVARSKLNAEGKKLLSTVSGNFEGIE
jgi:hypothetical protein